MVFFIYETKYLPVRERIREQQEVVPDGSQGGENLRERCDDIFLAMAVRSNRNKINFLRFIDIRSLVYSERRING